MQASIERELDLGTPSIQVVKEAFDTLEKCLRSDGESELSSLISMLGRVVLDLPKNKSLSVKVSQQR